MSEYITLMGSEQVQSAGRNMASAADTMRSAAGSIDESLRQHRRFMDDWLMRLENILDTHSRAMLSATPHAGEGDGES
jgi:hypothetical protein